jgi:hypothetical protein
VSTRKHGDAREHSRDIIVIWVRHYAVLEMALRRKRQMPPRLWTQGYSRARDALLLTLRLDSRRAARHADAAVASDSDATDWRWSDLDAGRKAKIVNAA